MTPIGICRIVNATLNAVMDPAASPDARLVETRNVSWVTPRPMARGAISTSASRAAGSRRSTPDR